MDAKPQSKASEKSYLFAAVDSMSPWGTSRTASQPPKEGIAGDLNLQSQQGGDHSVSTHHGISSRRYPRDCPSLHVRWFYAVDVPKRKPKLLSGADSSATAKPPPPPKKFVTFSVHDSKSIEAVYQQLVDESDAGENTKRSGQQTASEGQNTSLTDAGKNQIARTGHTVPVHEDFLFDVDLELRELAPVYWLGPIYEVRRGIWFYQDGSTQKPCEENLAAQLEEGYLKVKPFRYPKPTEKVPVTTSSGKVGEETKNTPEAPEPDISIPGDEMPKPIDNGIDTKGQNENSTAPRPPQTHRLFGTYMNSVVTYQDSTVAWISTDNIMSRMSSTVYQRFAGGAYFSGVKVIRGFIDVKKQKDSKTDAPMTPKTASFGKPITGLQLDEKQQKILKRRSAPPTSMTEAAISDIGQSDEEKEIANKNLAGAGHGSLSQSLKPIQKGEDDEDIRSREEHEIREDYSDNSGEEQSRDVEHLILVTHGIGQRLGMRTESVNFIHDVNVLRKTLKSVYTSSADLQALNSEIDKLPKNCRVQVLPVCWRHLLDFPRQGLKQNRKEYDLGDSFEEEEYPSLEDITIEGMPFVRSLITDLALDILLYQSAYREHISRIVLQECNRIHKLFLDRNPNFKGSISLCGHSLGSAILFDILCRQKDESWNYDRAAHRKHHRTQSERYAKKDIKDLSFDFRVEDFYCLGSPIALFQMLKGRTVAARKQPDAFPSESPMNLESLEDPFLAAGASRFEKSNSAESEGMLIPWTVSSPKCSQLYNIFHPTDPISYRIEPLVSPAMASLKPQLLPYTKKGLFGASTTQGFSGLGAMVGQGFSGLWSSVSSGITSSLLNRSLGLTGEDVARMGAASSARGRETVRAGASDGPPTGTGPEVDVPSLIRENTEEKKRQLAQDTAAADRDGRGATAPTLIDDDIETLYAGFEKGRKSNKDEDFGDGSAWAEAEEKSKRLRREEAKVRALNRNGRVDFSIQESVLDFNPINTIASHLSYWGDEDVSHFMLSQLLSRQRRKSRN